MRFIFCFALLTVFLFPSCRKEKMTMQFTAINTGTGRDINGICFVDDSTGYAVGGERYNYGDILITADGGETWNAQNAGVQKAIYKPFFLNKDTGFAAAYEGKLLRTTDGGISWQLYQSYWIPAYDIKFVNDSTGIACGGNGFSRGIIFRTTDMGNSWSIDTFQNEFRSLFFTDESTGYCAGYGMIMKTSDGGESWQPTTAKGDFFTSVYFTDAVTGFAVGLNGIILKTSNAGSTWERLRNANNVLKKKLNYTQIVFRNASIGYAIGWDGLMMKTINGGQDWITITNAPSENFNGIVLTDSGGFIAAAGGKIYRFVD